jgi:hypothetical protein
MLCKLQIFLCITFFAFRIFNFPSHCRIVIRIL